MRAPPGGQAVVLMRLDPLAAGLGARPLSAQRGCFCLFARRTWTRWGLQNTSGVYGFAGQAPAIESGSVHATCDPSGMCKGFDVVETIASDRVLTVPCASAKVTPPAVFRTPVCHGAFCGRWTCAEC